DDRQQSLPLFLNRLLPALVAVPDWLGSNLFYSRWVPVKQVSPNSDFLAEIHAVFLSVHPGLPVQPSTLNNAGQTVEHKQPFQSALPSSYPYKKLHSGSVLFFS